MTSVIADRREELHRGSTRFLLSETSVWCYGGGGRWSRKLDCGSVICGAGPVQSSKKSVSEVFGEQAVDVEGDGIVGDFQKVGKSTEYLQKLCARTLQ